MRPQYHVAITTVIAGGMVPKVKRFPWAFWLAGFLADVDHYVWFVWNKKRWHPLEAWVISRDEQERDGKERLFLHRWPLILLLLILGRKRRVLKEVSLGLALHRLVDDFSRWWPRWQYRRRRQRYYRHWYTVAKRAGYRCQHCGAVDTVLELHHVIPVAEGGEDRPSNMIVLCPECHRRAHVRLSGLNEG